MAGASKKETVMPNPRLIREKVQPKYTRIRNEMDDEDRELLTSLWIENESKSKCGLCRQEGHNRRRCLTRNVELTSRGFGITVISYNKPCAQKKFVDLSVGSSKRPQVWSTTGDVSDEDMHGDPTAVVAKDGDDEVDVDTAATVHTIVFS
nr:hypothetical protein CFP56_73494 [Quercus suber]